MAPGLWIKLLAVPNPTKHKDPTVIDIIGRLPEEISVHILRMLDNATLVSCALVSKRWFQVIHSDPNLRFRVFNRLRRLRWLKQKYGEPKEPKELPRILMYGVERVYSVMEKYHNYKDRREEKRKAIRGDMIYVQHTGNLRLLADFLRRKILRGPKELVPGLDLFAAPLPAQTAVYRQQSFYGEGHSFR